MSSRLLPLQTCGVSFLTIAHTTCSRAQNLNGWFGSTARKIVRLTNLLNPFIFVLQYQCLLFLSFIDESLLAIANIVEITFPPSKLIFDQLDQFLRLIQTFPRIFDDAVEKLPCFNQVAFLEWAVIRAISLLKFTIAILMNWGRDGAREKEILVDINYDKGRKGSESAHKSDCCSEGTILSVNDMDEKMKSGTEKEEEKEDGNEELEHDAKVEYEENCKKDEKNEAKMKGSVEKKEEEGMKENEENILELFERGWVMKPASAVKTL